MKGAEIGFIIWAVAGIAIAAIGVRAMFAKKAVGFWANANPPKIKEEDIKPYNRATGLLLTAYGIVFVLLGLPLLFGQNSAIILVSVVGAMLESIALMVIYTLGISKKFS